MVPLISTLCLGIVLLCGSAFGCSQEDISGCAPSNYTFDENAELNRENCKIGLKINTCISKVANRCPNLKSVIESFLERFEANVKQCEELIASGATTTRWSGLVLIVAVMILGGFFYV